MEAVVKKVLVLTALALAVSVASASAKPAKHHVKAAPKVSAAQLYDYVPVQASWNQNPQIPLILGVTY